MVQCRSCLVCVLSAQNFNSRAYVRLKKNSVDLISMTQYYIYICTESRQTSPITLLGSFFEDLDRKQRGKRQKLQNGSAFNFNVSKQ